MAGVGPIFPGKANLYRNAYCPPDGRHLHQCGHCFTIWEHADSRQGSRIAHTCPKCGFEWKCLDHYYGIAPPDYQDERPEPSEPERRSVDE